MNNDQTAKNHRARNHKHKAQHTPSAAGSSLESRTPRLKLLQKGDRRSFLPNHPDETSGYKLLMKAIGTDDLYFLNGILAQIVNAGMDGSNTDEAGINFMLSVVEGIKPRDQLEAMLAAQIAAVHVASMRFANRLAHVETIPEQDSDERALNKLTRTYISQMAALKHYRTGGEQKVTVQHVSVSEGGQAIVGNVTQTSSKNPSKQTAAPPLAITDAKTTPLPLIKESKERVPLPVRTKSQK